MVSLISLSVITMQTIHSLTEHTFRLNSLCRLCGERAKRVTRDKNKVTCFCGDFAKDILEHHDVDISKDEDGSHPKTWYAPTATGDCYDIKLKKTKKRKQ